MPVYDSVLVKMLQWEEEELKDRNGRLIEREQIWIDVASGKYIRMGFGRLRAPVYKSTRPSSNRGVSFHFAHTFASKVAVKATDKRMALHPDRLYLFPRKAEVSSVREAGGSYDRKAGSWWVARTRENERRFAAMSGEAARAQHARRMMGRGRRLKVTPPGFQRYLERAGQSDAARRRELLTDSSGNFVSFGSIGETLAERVAFWDRVAEVERRSDARVQCRLIIEIPHELEADEMRDLALEFTEVFRSRRLPYHAVIHLPDVAKGSDERNVHLHIAYHDRPCRRTGPYEWRFASRKDREAQGAAWVAGLRDLYAEMANERLARADQDRRARGLPGIEKRYDPRPYRESGVEKLPGVHLGGPRTQLERAGVTTAAGVVNAERELLWRKISAAAESDAFSRRAAEILLRAANSGGDLDAIERAAELVARRAAAMVEEAGRIDPAERAAVRAEWIRAEEEGLRRRRKRQRKGDQNADDLSGRRLMQLAEIRKDLEVLSAASAPASDDGGEQAVLAELLSGLERHVATVEAERERRWLADNRVDAELLGGAQGGADTAAIRERLRLRLSEQAEHGFDDLVAVCVGTGVPLDKAVDAARSLRESAGRNGVAGAVGTAREMGVSNADDVSRLAAAAGRAAARLAAVERVPDRATAASLEPRGTSPGEGRGRKQSRGRDDGLER